jgi:DNA repair protein RadC
MTADQRRYIVRETHARLRQYGPQTLSSVELLAIVLGTGATKDAFTVGEDLVLRSGGLVGIARMALAELELPDGMGAAKAAQLKAALELGRRMVTATLEPRPQVKTPADAAQLCIAEMGLSDQEEVRTLLLDTRNRLLGLPIVYRGSLNGASIRIAEVFRDAIRCNAASIIVSHSHPSGDPSPSAEDVLVTREIVQAGRLLGVAVLDHIVVAQNRYVSLKERGLGFESV